MRSTVQGRWLLAVLVVVMLGASAQAGAQTSMSAPLAAELAEALVAADLGAVAARDGDSDRFVAALYFPGQLLVVSARYQAPVYLVEKIAAQDYREVYIDLNSASIADTKMLITDVGADGPTDGDMYDNGSRTMNFAEAGAEADEQYSRMLKALLAQIR